MTCKAKEITSFLDFSSSELKLLSNKAKNKFSTIKLPITNVGRNMAKHVEAPSCQMEENFRFQFINSRVKMYFIKKTIMDDESELTTFFK